MTGGKKPQLGFTIVETLIVLAVSGVIFLSATLLISGRVNKTEFTQAIQDIQSKTQASINQVINGYYQNNNDLKCTALGNGPHLTQVTSTNEGTNQDCTYIGKAIQFAVGSNASQFNTYTIAALRQTASGQEITSLTEAKPKVIAAGIINADVPDNEYDSQQLENGLSVVGMYYDGNPAQSVGTVAFMNDPAGLDTGGTNLVSGAQQVSLYVIPNTGLNKAKAGEVDVIDANLAAAIKPTKGVQICFKSGTTNSWMLMDIGKTTTSGSSDQLAVTMTIEDTDCSS